MTKPNALNVAKYIVEHQKDISLLKLNELIYYCQAWHLALFKRPFFKNLIKTNEKTIYIPDLYQINQSHHNFNHYLLHEDKYNYNFSNDQRAVMDGVLKSYGQDDSNLLIQRIHRETPWMNAKKIAKNRHKDKSVIKLSDMKNYYAKLVEE